MNKKNRLLTTLFLISLIGIIGCYAMIAAPDGFREDTMPRTDPKKSMSVVYNISYDEESLPYVTIYYNIAYSGITFLKADSFFKASFRLNVNIKYEGETIVNKNITEVLRTKDYSKTISSEKLFFGTFKETISTGKNEILLMLMDNNSDRKYVWKREVPVPETPETLIEN